MWSSRLLPELPESVISVVALLPSLPGAPNENWEKRGKEVEGGKH